MRRMVLFLALILSLVAFPPSAIALYEDEAEPPDSVPPPRSPLEPPDSDSYVSASSAPRAASSFYMNSTSLKLHYDRGYALGQRDLNLAGTQDRLVILDYGQALRRTFRNSTGGVYYEYGANRFSAGFANVSTIQFAVQEFAKGYYYGTGSDTASHLRIGIGTNNLGKLYSTSEGGGFKDIAVAHGRAWANMVDNVMGWLGGSNPDNRNYTGQVDVAGAIDMEIGWNTASDSLPWVDGYESVNNWPYIDFGDAAGCPVDQTGPANEPCTGGPGWTVQNAWYKAAGPASARAVPQILRTDETNAKQWRRLSLYGANVKSPSDRINFVGSITIHGECVDNGPTRDPDNQYPDCPPSIDNKAPEGWRQLQSWINLSAETRMGVRWSTDIQYEYR